MSQKITRFAKFAVLPAVLVSGFLVLSAFGPGGGRFANPEKIDKFVTFKINDMLDDINATPAQRAKVLSVKDTMLSKFIANRESRKAAREAMVAQWKSEKPDPAAVHAAIDAQFDSMRAMAHEAADHALEIHAMLTPEQREQVAGRFAHGGMFQP